MLLGKLHIRVMFLGKVSGSSVQIAFADINGRIKGRLSIDFPRRKTQFKDHVTPVAAGLVKVKYLVIKAVNDRGEVFVGKASCRAGVQMAQRFQNLRDNDEESCTILFHIIQLLEVKKV